MININTLDELNRLGFGADISKLESYAVDYKQANFVSDLTDYEYDYLKISRLLKEIKPESNAFNDNTYLNTLELNDLDNLFINNPSYFDNIIYGCNDENISNICNYIKQNEENCVSFVAIPNIQGLNIKCTYKNGYLCNINLIGNEYKYKDITEYYRYCVPNFVEKLKNVELTEVRGKITIFNNKDTNKVYENNIICSVMNLIRLNIENDLCSIVIDDIYTSDESNEYNQWDKIEYIRELGFSVPHHALIRNVDEETLIQSFNSFVDYFENIENTSGIVYSYSGLQIIDNDSKIRFLYKFDSCNYNKVFNSKIKSVIFNNRHDVSIKIKIVSTKCNDRITIDEINVYDINILNTYKIHSGEKIYFIVNNKTPILIKNK